ncbi:MAG TPA: reverse transcriptase-like protein [Candidatus Saccharimonadales bacterium]|nr:reverse transcriptase-like protein [Candidatus Saccharimonadales bacterium]
MWQEKDNKLYQKFTFKDFREATDFINKVAVIANELNHHPTIHNTYSTVELWLSTHEAGDTVTEKDREFAARIDELAHSATKISQPALPKQVKMFADGGSRGNPGPSASGYVLLDMDDKVLTSHGEYLGITTNNQAEYQAVKFGLEDALKRGAREVAVYLDSLLVVNQMNGVFKIRNRELWPIHVAIQELLQRFKKVTFAHVPRELNKLADAEVNKALDRQAAN